MRRSLPPKKCHLRRLPPARLQEGVRDPHHQSGIHHPMTEIESPTPLHPNVGEHGPRKRLSDRILDWVLGKIRIQKK
jgi:hypothetical protein